MICAESVLAAADSLVWCRQYLTHFDEQGFRRDRLLQVGQLRVDEAVARYSFIRVARHAERLHVRADITEATHELGTTHDRHHAIRGLVTADRSWFSRSGLR